MIAPDTNNNDNDNREAHANNDLIAPDTRGEYGYVRDNLDVDVTDEPGGFGINIDSDAVPEAPLEQIEGTLEAAVEAATNTNRPVQQQRRDTTAKDDISSDVTAENIIATEPEAHRPGTFSYNLRREIPRGIPDGDFVLSGLPKEFVNCVMQMVIGPKRHACDFNGKFVCALTQMTAREGLKRFETRQ